MATATPHIPQELSADGRPELTARIRYYPETFEEPSETLLTKIRDAAAELPCLMQAFLGHSIQSWTLEDLDRAFSAWQRAADKGRFTSEKVIQITGATIILAAPLMGQASISCT